MNEEIKVIKVPIAPKIDKARVIFSLVSKMEIPLLDTGFITNLSSVFNNKIISWGGDDYQIESEVRTCITSKARRNRKSTGW